jgi:predicted methyltransferase MtxX (methanogen marker protein 4)
MTKTSVRFHIVGLVLSLTGALWFFRATVLVGYAAGYGIAQADRNHRVFMLTTRAFLVAFIALAISFGVNAIRSRKNKGRVS